MNTLPESFNLRDLGGLPTRDGRAVATGRFYRSGEPPIFDRASASAFYDIGFRTVIDLRTTLELEERGTGPRRPGCRYLHLPLFEYVRSSWIAAADQSPAATARRYFEMLGDGTETLAAIVREVGEPGTRPFVIHCAAGRDRTGIVVACLLDLLGVTDDAIADDYALSDATSDDGSRAHSRTILEFFALLRDHHGSTRELLGAHDIPEDLLTQLSRDLLTDATS